TTRRSPATFHPTPRERAACWSSPSATAPASTARRQGGDLRVVIKMKKGVSINNMARKAPSEQQRWQVSDLIPGEGPNVTLDQALTRAQRRATPGQRPICVFTIVRP